MKRFLLLIFLLYASNVHAQSNIDIMSGVELTNASHAFTFTVRSSDSQGANLTMRMPPSFVAGVLCTDASGNLTACTGSTATTILGTVTTGTWQATAISFAYGGTGLTTAADDTLLVSTGSAWQAKAAPDCDTAGCALQYDTTGNAFAANSAIEAATGDSATSFFAAGTLENARTTATSANTASAIVARDGSGNFTAGTISAALSGNASTATALAANGANCSAGQYPLGVDASGAVESCTAVSAGITVGTTTITSGTDTRVPFNDAGVYGEDAGLTFIKATDTLLTGLLGLGTTTAQTLNTVSLTDIKLQAADAGDAFVAINSSSGVSGRAEVYSNVSGAGVNARLWSDGAVGDGGTSSSWGVNTWTDAGVATRRFTVFRDGYVGTESRLGVGTGVSTPNGPLEVLGAGGTIFGSGNAVGGFRNTTNNANSTVNISTTGAQQAAILTLSNNQTATWYVLSDGTTPYSEAAGGFAIADSAVLPRFSILPSGPVKLHSLDAVTNAVTTVVKLSHDTSGTPAAGYGAALDYYLESSTTAGQLAGRIAHAWTDATHGSLDADVVFSSVVNSVLTESFRVTGAGDATLQSQLAVGTALESGVALSVARSASGIGISTGNSIVHFQMGSTGFLDISVPSTATTGVRFDAGADTAGAIIYRGSGDSPASTMELHAGSAERLRIAANLMTVTGRIKAVSTAPTLSACGTTPSIAGSDTAGKVTVGSGGATSCTLTFATAYGVAPACSAMNETTEQTMKAVSTTTTLVLSSATDFTSDVVAYQCIQGS